MRVILSIVFFCLGLLAGFVLDKDDTAPWFTNVREGSSNYTFINPLLFVDVSEDLSYPEYTPLREVFNEYVDNALAEGKANDISIYFRNLNGSQRISINPSATFFPASMLKVVTLTAVLREAESQPGFLSRSITLNGNDNDLVSSQSWYPVTHPVRSGGTYTVKELLGNLIIESDNVANAALISLVGNNKIVKVYADLRLPEPDLSDENGYTAEQYSHLFRALYNGTYLSRASSENALALLSKAKFDKGLVAGVPKGTVAAHKFGVKTIDPLSLRELHDCGIVYYPETPYFICVMTRGKEFASLEKVISDISALAWKQVSEINR